MGTEQFWARWKDVWRFYVNRLVVNGHSGYHHVKSKSFQLVKHLMHMLKISPSNFMQPDWKPKLTQIKSTLSTSVSETHRSNSGTLSWSLVQKNRKTEPWPCEHATLSNMAYSSLIM